MLNTYRNCLNVWPQLRTSTANKSQNKKEKPGFKTKNKDRMRTWKI